MSVSLKAELATLRVPFVVWARGNPSNLYIGDGKEFWQRIGSTPSYVVYRADGTPYETKLIRDEESALVAQFKPDTQFYLKSAKMAENLYFLFNALGTFESNYHFEGSTSIFLIDKLVHLAMWNTYE